MKQGKNIVGLVVMGVMILFALFAYFSFNNMSASKDVIEAENKGLSKDVMVLKGYQENSDQTQADKVKYEQEMKDIIAQFPKEVRPEDLIMYAQSFEQNEELVVKNIDMPVPNKIPIKNTTGLPQQVKQQLKRRLKEQLTMVLLQIKHTKGIKGKNMLKLRKEPLFQQKTLWKTEKQLQHMHCIMLLLK